ncbi:MAG TPA: YraN family protein [Desulfotomaculum sp.]|nr:MAG: hypothetical protein XD84_1099 [Desulfotomaculum sp. 46_80]HAG10758.1 YraN family protein [Desulfotomaculum sp.]HBY04542.1 YraN family protein [Desulfotomaculum sp.]
MSNQRQNLGRRGEDEAVSYLRKKGYILLQRNYRCPLGEIDVIAKDSKTLVFIEVRARSSERFGTPQESVNRNKMLKIHRVAQYYLKTVQKEEEPVRFDVLALMFDLENQLKQLEHIKGAF